MGIRSSYVARLASHTVRTVIQGRSISVRLQAHGGGRLQCIAVHVDPSFSRPRIEQVMRTLLREVDDMAPRFTLIGGDWNFMEQSGGCLHTGAGNMHKMPMESTGFHRVLPHGAEHDTEDAAYSRIDR